MLVCVISVGLVHLFCVCVLGFGLVCGFRIVFFDLSFLGFAGIDVWISGFGLGLVHMSRFGFLGLAWVFGLLDGVQYRFLGFLNFRVFLIIVFALNDFMLYSVFEVDLVWVCGFGVLPWLWV